MMIFEQHYLDCLSQASYFIGDQTSGRAVVVDPRRDIAPYLASAAEHGMTIELVIETHFHADFVSGHLELAAATGAPIMYGDKAETEFESIKARDGERISLGTVALEILHTPGHTPESISIVVYADAAETTPHAVLTGDTLFIGDVGRPDLLSSAGVTSEELASSLYDSLHNKLLTLPDDTLLYPGHGAGSSCGKNLSSDTSCTIGRQRESNYALAKMSKDDFIEVVTSGQTAPPAYFSYDATMNRSTRPLFTEDANSKPLTLEAVLAAQADGAVVIDSRAPEDFASGHLKGSINVGLAGRYSEFVGAVVAAGSSIVIVADEDRHNESVTRLARIGFDNVVGYLEHPLQAFVDAPHHVTRSKRIDVDQLRDLLSASEDLQLVDVRQPGETAGGHIAGATLMPLTTINNRLGELDPSKPTLIYCAGGFRSSIAASALQRQGFSDVTDLLGGYGAWIA